MFLRPIRPARRAGLAAVLLAAGLLTGCSTTSHQAGPPAAGGAGRAGADLRPGGEVPSAPARDPQAVAPKEIPGLGPETLAALSPSTGQVVLATGPGEDSNRGTVTLYEREPVTGWRPVSGPWPAHNGRRGWTDDHHSNDLRTPVGVFGLTDAGGLLSDPGTKLPYDHGPGFISRGTGFDGESLAGAFDYVVAVNYNRKPGVSPLDWTMPLGADRGHGLWIHVDHGGPTHACVSVPEARMKELLRWLDPAKKPVVAMGDAAWLAR